MNEKEIIKLIKSNLQLIEEICLLPLNLQKLKKRLKKFLLALVVRRLADFSEAQGGIVAHRAVIKSRHQDFVQNRFEFYPKDTANLPG